MKHKLIITKNELCVDKAIFQTRFYWFENQTSKSTTISWANQAVFREWKLRHLTYNIRWQKQIHAAALFEASIPIMTRRMHSWSMYQNDTQKILTFEGCRVNQGPCQLNDLIQEERNNKDGIDNLRSKGTFYCLWLAPNPTICKYHPN